LKGKFMVS